MTVLIMIPLGAISDRRNLHSKVFLSYRAVSRKGRFPFILLYVCEYLRFVNNFGGGDGKGNIGKR